MKIKTNPIKTLNEYFESTINKKASRLSTAVERTSNRGRYSLSGYYGFNQSVTSLESASVEFDELWITGELPCESAFQAFVEQQSFNAGFTEELTFA